MEQKYQNVKQSKPTLEQVLELKQRSVPLKGVPIVSETYLGDRMGHALAHLKKGALWITLTSHLNVVAIAKQKNAAGVILASGEVWDKDAVEAGITKEIPLYESKLTPYQLAKALSLYEK